jgi:UDP-GlcNAc3NAcA epimerase
VWRGTVRDFYGSRELKVLSVVGARPQFVKAAIVSKSLRSVAEISEITVHTGQHYDDNLSQIFFTELGIQTPAYNLGIGSGTHGKQTGRMLEGIERVLLEEKPDWVLVYGDTNSTLAGALAASKLHFPVAHVEAGLRSFNRMMPEEINRVLTDHTSDLLFAPTKLAVKNLLNEGICGEKVQQIGDVMYDAALCYGGTAEKKSSILERLKLKPKGYILATIHRAENSDDPNRLGAIVSGLHKAAAAMPVVFPVHPRTRNVLFTDQNCVRGIDGMLFVDPVGYLDMTMLERNARLIATDSGGVQKEAFFFSVPCVTFRTETEWQELIDIGWNRLAPPADQEAVAQAIQLALTETPVRTQSPYGDGHAADRIAEHLLQRSSGIVSLKFASSSLSRSIP